MATKVGMGAKKKNVQIDDKTKAKIAKLEKENKELKAKIAKLETPKD